MNAVPPCFNPAHHHKRPEESVEDLAKFFQMIYDTARSIKPDAIVEWCPCGTAFNFYNLPNLNMSVASDPHNSWQVRTKGKSLKALHGDGTAYFGDHVELSDGHQDFASTVGIGGVVGTQFTWPVGSGRRRTYDLTPEKEAIWQKWISLYKDKMLSRGEYLGGLYDIGFDRPEAHAIESRTRCTTPSTRRNSKGRSSSAAWSAALTKYTTTKTIAIWVSCRDLPVRWMFSSRATCCWRPSRNELGRPVAGLSSDVQPGHSAARPAPHADALGPHSLRRDRHSAHGADVGFRRVEQSRPRPRRHHHTDRHGGDAVHRHQLRPDGARLSQRRVGIHLCGPGDQPGARVCHRMEHGDGLHAQSADLHRLDQPAGARFRPCPALLGVGGHRSCWCSPA